MARTHVQVKGDSGQLQVCCDGGMDVFNQTRNQSHIKYEPAKDERPRGGHEFQQALWFPRSD